MPRLPPRGPGRVFIFPRSAERTEMWTCSYSGGLREERPMPVTSCAGPQFSLERMAISISWGCCDKQLRTGWLRTALAFRSLAAQSCPAFCDPMDCSPPGPLVHGISQTRILKWVAIFFPKGSSLPRDRTWVSCIGRWILYH